MSKIRHKTNHWLPKLLNVYAITLYPFVLYSEEKPSISVIAHELVHIDQIKAYGWFRFYLSYLLYYFAERLRSRDHFTAYLTIDYEQSARRLEKTKEYLKRAKEVQIQHF